MKKPVALLAGAFCASLISLDAAAQDEPPKAATPQKASASLEEVLVTARRRRESLQETPIAVTALSGAELQERGIVNVGELTKSVPSVQITESVSNLIYIRGIGQRAAFARVDPTVGVYLDNIFLPRADGHLMDTVDVENIQVLRGPQGTLFGKNTTGGAMVLTLEKPKAETEGYVFGSVGNYERVQVRGAYNTPLSDNVFARIAFNHLQDDGFFEDDSQGETNTSKGRTSLLGQVRWEISSDALLDTLLYAGRIDERLPGSYCTFMNEDAVLVKGLYLMWPGDTDPSNPTAYRENCESNSRERLGDLKSNMGKNNMMDRELDTYLAAATLDWELTDSLSLKMVAGARHETKGPLISSDQDGGPGNFNESFTRDDGERESYSFELQVNGTLFDGAVTYTGGAFFMEETNTEVFTLINSLNGLDATTAPQVLGGQQPSAPPPNGSPGPLIGILVDPTLDSAFDLRNFTKAYFFQGSWDMTEQLELTLGIRYTSERRQSDLVVTGTDRNAVGQRLLTSGRFAPDIVGGSGFYVFNGIWAEDPVSIAMSYFPDVDGDGINDFPYAAQPFRVDEKDNTFTKTTPMASLSYQFSEDVLPEHWDTFMIYGTWSSGFKSGFFEPKGVDGLQQVEPEEVENRELGMKLEAFRRSLRFNMAAYHMDFDNQQLIQVDADSNNNLVVIYQNAGQSEIKGVEMELQWMPSPGLMINMSASHNDYTFTDFKDNDLLQAALGRQVEIDRSDETFPVSPETTAAFGIQYAFNPDIGVITPRLDYSYKSEVYYGLDDGAHTLYQQDKDLAGQSAYSVMDFRLMWQNNEGNRTAAFWVKNVLDERYDIGIAAVGDSVATFFQTYGDPRRFGIEYRQTF
ncbi:outer membrane receptor protein involved in Fe transport [Litorivivens lipolytica]|uniref:Outer membrane receptor protein involved in Fe transport n=1 Tax=Litorivivens lipolytica TaxID=1524264 RepID=A0A7W4W7B0_9GAMM|nr:TonB-dependent receptor [Litorivivens lipolytica]MBB3048730.1 outer membrane receptor protein involved in Fe transport [Litorivivens lipolytica]